MTDTTCYQPDALTHYPMHHSARLYVEAYERIVSGDGCEVLPLDRPTGYARVDYVYAPDGTVYRVPSKDLHMFADADDVTPWQVPTTCASCGRVLDHLHDDRGARADYPYCSGCHYTGLAGDSQHADVVAACAARGMLAYVEQTGGGCMDLRIRRIGVEPAPGVVDHYDEPWSESIVAVGAERGDHGEWFTLDASVPEPGGSWCAWHMASPEYEAGEAGPDVDTFAVDADALAAWADRMLAPAPTTD